MRAFVLASAFVLATLAAPAPVFASGGDVLLAIEAARGAQTTQQRWQAASQLEALAYDEAPGAAGALASLILDGVIDGRPSSARMWAERGHEAGEPDASLLLARMVAEGVGGERDVRLAADYAREAAVAGSPAAGVLVYELLATTESASAGYVHLERAARTGYAPAMLFLGLHYAAGEGVDASNDEALFWLLLAEAHGESEASRMVDAVAALLPPEEVVRLTRAALEWEPN